MEIKLSLLVGIALLARGMQASEADTRQLTACGPLSNIVSQIESAIDACCASINSKLPCNSITTIRQANIPYTITTPGHYCLATDITFGGPTAISIVTTHDVDLNLNGHTIDLLGTGTTGIFIGSALRVNVYDGNVIHTVTTPNTAANNSFAGILAINTTYVNIDRINTIDCFQGVRIDGCEYAKVRESQFGISSRGIRVVDSASTTIDGCTIRDAVRGIDVENSVNCLIANCQAFNSFDLVITRTVDSSFCFSAEAVDNMTMYNCQAFINSNDSSGINLSAVRSGILDHCNVNIVGSTTDLNCIQTDQAVNCQVKNCQFRNPTAVPGFDCMITTGSNISIDNCLFESNAHASIIDGALFGTNLNLLGTLGDSAYGYRITNCQFTSQVANSILINGSSAGFASNIVIDNCSVQQATTNGILIFDAFDVAVKNSQISGNNNGITLTGSKGVVVLENVVNGNTVDGISLDASCIDCAIHDNKVLNNGSFGIENLGSGNQFYHNFAQNNGVNYAGVSPVSIPAAGLGSLENIDA